MINKLHYCLLVPSVVTLASSCSVEEQSQRPNIIWIMSDDHSYNSMSCYDSRYSDIFKTPNIDRIADNGALLTNCFVTNSISTPSRATILTGKYGHKTGVYTLHDELSTESVTYPMLLHDSGYKSAIFGKWHLKTEPQGFDHYSVLHGQGTYFNPRFMESGMAWSSNKKDGRQEKGYTTDIITDNALDWLKKQEGSEEPILLMIHHKAPHGLWEYAPRHEHLFDGVTIPAPENLHEDREANQSEASAPFGPHILKLADRMAAESYPTGALDIEGMSDDEKIDAAYQKYMKDYLRVTAAVDENVGRVLDYVENSPMAENTIIVYTSDQSLFLGEHGRYDKRWIFEETLKMPFIISYPKEISRGVRYDDMITNLDFAELLLDYAGVDAPSDMQGESFRKILSGGSIPNWRESFYYHYWMNFKTTNVPAHYGIRTKQYKLINIYGRSLGLNGTTPGWETPQGWELYDIQNDPHESHNLYDDPKYSSVIEELKRELRDLQTEYEVTPCPYK